MSKTWTKEEVIEWINDTFTLSYVLTEEGQAHLNRVGAAATNESIEKRKTTNKNNKAEAEFNAVLAKLSVSAPEEVPAFIAGKDGWIKEWIAKKNR